MAIRTFRPFDVGNSVGELSADPRQAELRAKEQNELRARQISQAMQIALMGDQTARRGQTLNAQTQAANIGLGYANLNQGADQFNKSFKEGQRVGDRAFGEGQFQSDRNFLSGQQAAQHQRGILDQQMGLQRDQFGLQQQQHDMQAQMMRQAMMGALQGRASQPHPSLMPQPPGQNPNANVSGRAPTPGRPAPAQAHSAFDQIQAALRNPNLDPGTRQAMTHYLIQLMQNTHGPLFGTGGTVR